MSDLAKRVIAFLAAVVFAVGVGVFMWTRRPTPAPAARPAAAKTAEPRAKREKPAPRVPVSGAPVRARAGELSHMMNAESSYAPFKTGPQAGRGIYELLATWGIADRLDDTALQDALHEGLVWPDTHTQSENDRRIALMDSEYDRWVSDLWTLANDRLDSTADEVHDGLPTGFAACPALRDVYGSYPGDGSDRAAFDATVAWLARVDSVQAACGS